MPRPSCSASAPLSRTAPGFDATDRGKTLNRGVAAAHAVMVRIFEKLPAGEPLTFDDIVEAENKILKAIKHSSLREWLTTVGCHHTDSYRHCLFVTGFAVAFAQHLGMREDDQRRLARAALLHDVGKAFIPVAILDKPGALTDEEMAEIREHPRLGYRRARGARRLSRRRCWTWSCTITNCSTAPDIPTASAAIRSATSCA